MGRANLKIPLHGVGDLESVSVALSNIKPLNGEIFLFEFGYLGVGEKEKLDADYEEVSKLYSLGIGPES